jgi:hypothetical protein
MDTANREATKHSWHELYHTILDKLTPHIKPTACACSPTEQEEIRKLWAARGPRKVHHKFVGYVRASDELALDEQYERIEQFAKEHNIDLQETYCDLGVPQGGLSHALEALENTDGLIACNLDRFVTHHDDRLRDLRPLLHHFCCRGAKHLITIDEGIDTGTPLGQMAAVEIINEQKSLAV